MRSSILLPSAKTEIIVKTEVISKENKKVEVPKAKLKPTPEPTPEPTPTPKVEEKVVQASPDENGIATYHGAMSGYGPDCAGCGNHGGQ